MTKGKKTVIAVLAVLLVLSIAAAVLTSLKGGDGVIVKDEYDPDGKVLSEYINENTPSFESEYPLVQTQQKNLFYEMYPDGTIKYFKYDGGAFNEVTDGVKTKTVNFECSYQKLSVKLYYLKTESGTVGYGLFDSEQNSSVKLLSYVFVRLMDCPAAFKSAAKTDYVLLVSRNAEEAYRADKSYSEMYSYDMKSGTAMLVISQRDRTVQEDGTVNEGWTIFTDSSLNSAKKHDLFASTRVNDAKAEKPLYCIMTVANSRAGKKAQAATVTNCVSREIREKDGNYFCFASTKDGFDLIKNGDKKKPLKSFKGSFSDYTVSGDWIFDKANSELTCITTGETVSVEKRDYSKLTGFATDEAGNKFAFFISSKKPAIIIFDRIEKTENAMAGDSLFDIAIGNYSFINGETFMFSDYVDSDVKDSAVSYAVSF